MMYVPIEILANVGWKTLQERREEQMASYVSKALNTDKCPPNITSMFEISNNTNNSLRSNNNMLMLKSGTNSLVSLRKMF